MVADNQILDESTIATLREKCKKSLYFLCKAVLGFNELSPEIHGPICRDLEDYERNTRIAVILPRTWFKSTIGSIGYPIWRAINDPNVRILIAQNSITNAKKKINSIKQIFEQNGLFRVLFPDLLPTGVNPWSSECLTVNRTITCPEGTFEPAGTGTAVTSRHYDVIIQDDTVAPDFDAMTGEMQQPTNMEIEKAIGWHKLCHPLLIHPTKSQILLIGTRWAVNDLLGYILTKTGSRYKIITRSALENANGDPASEDQGGKPIWDRFNLDVLHELRESVGPLMFDMLYMNTPSAGINEVFKREYWADRYYENMPTGLIFCTSVDPSPTDQARVGADPDYNVTLTTAINPATGEVWVVHYDREHCNPGDAVNRIFAHYEAYKPMQVRIETVAYQKTLKYWVQERQRKLNKFFYIEDVANARTSKEARIMALQPWFAAKRVRIRTFHSDLERELLAFSPNIKARGHDDVIDALSMHVPFWSQCIDSYQSEQEEEQKADPFMGAAIVDELLDRASEADRYPYDIGLMSERLKEKPYYKDYVYN